MMDYEKQNDPKLAENAMSTEHEDRFSAKMAGQAQGPVTLASFAHLDEKKILRKVCCSPLPSALRVLVMNLNC